MAIKPVTIVGMGDGGCVGLSSLAINRIVESSYLIGGERLLDFFPQYEGEKIAIKGSLQPILDRVDELADENSVCVLASGDPLYFGIGKRLIEKVGKDHVEIIPSPSSMQLAFASILERWDDAAYISLHGKNNLSGFITRLQRMHKVAVLTDLKHQPQVIASYMEEYGELDWHVYVCENMGGVDQKVSLYSVDELKDLSNFSKLNILIMIRKDRDYSPPPLCPSLPDESFFHESFGRGFITKSEIRLQSLSKMNIKPDSIVWDIGIGSGSVSVEAAKLAFNGQVFGIEKNRERLSVGQSNLKKHKVDNVILVEGLAPDALNGLKEPDSVFIGGSSGNLDSIIRFSLTSLRSGGSLVLNTVTIDSTAAAFSTFKDMGIDPEVSLLSVSRSKILGTSQKYEALNPIHIFSVKKD